MGQSTAQSKPAAAKQAIDDALKTKEASIDSRTDLTDEESCCEADAKLKSDEAKKEHWTLRDHKCRS